MTGVIIAAKDRDKKMWDQLPSVLCAHFPVVFARGKDLRMTGTTPEFVICDIHNAYYIPTDTAIILFREFPEAEVNIPAFQQAVAVVDTSNPTLLEQVSVTKLPAITCGLTARDTLTLSSFGVDSAVINLQRSLTCFDGSIAEPQEIPISLGASMDSFTIMAIAAVFILSGQIERLKQATFLI